MSDRKTFKKGERLKSRKAINTLFQKGESFARFPLRLVWMPMYERRSSQPVQFAVSVPKRRFRLATRRNRIKRQIREAYRLNKSHLYRFLNEDDPQIAFMILFLAAEERPYNEVERAMRDIIHRFEKKWKAHRASS
ncbi:MAG: ribonuclease P protein component [Saprospiraceae bacterium]|nr:ribonuclease P protein component [Saprospiraceae bacterium]